MADIQTINWSMHSHYQPCDEVEPSLRFDGLPDPSPGIRGLFKDEKKKKIHFPTMNEIMRYSHSVVASNFELVGTR